ncbi:ABC transporter permease [Paraflavitalea sp. CAU 1676]|uniref:ABC transporter permease n=1 Tax=Paraflavitalea sp. CAU 1676 TaxID=3032598 RepID=UPI0023DBDB26|nr:ABC transporter permease [Paraflavitalea sp. CAU 1676]MDF2192759.1 ABC transporter permease [Paraflavitalea sp. CAU 1676]
MWRNYLKTAWRNLLKNKVYSAINVLGLAAGMAVALLIGLWVYNEYSYDRFLPGYQQLYRVQRNFNSNGDTLTFRTTSPRLAIALANDIPEIEHVAISDWMSPRGLMVGDKKLIIRGAQIGGDFLKMFRYPLIKGNPNTVFSDPYSIVLTESTAKALFGDADPINKMVRYNNQHDLKVTGLLKDIPSNSTLQFNFIVPFSYLEQIDPNVKENRSTFDNNGYQIFVQLKPGATLAQVAGKIRNIEHIEKGSNNAMNSYITLQPLERWHLYSKYVNGQDTAGFLEYVNTFTLIGVLVLLIACINFINLTTARSEKRAREVGVRKAVGSRKKDLILQFLAESLVLTLIAFVFAIIFVQLALPAFNTLTEGQLALPVGNIGFWVLVLAGVIVTALIAGSRPAFYLSSFQPVKVLKSSIGSGRSSSPFRKILVVAQFSCSIALIISTVIIYQQVQHAKNRPSGYDLDRLVLTQSSSDLSRNYTALKNELIANGIASSVTTASSPATDIYWHSNLGQWPGKKADETVEMGIILVSEDYFKTMGMEIALGRDFAGLADSNRVIFNEAAIARLRIKDPINQTIRWGGRARQITGVVKDALMISPFAAADPTMFVIDPGVQDNLLYRLSPRMNPSDALAQLTAIFNKYNPAYPYQYEFADQGYAFKFKLEVLIGKLSALFAGLAIFISCLGLFGLAAYIAEQRTKEIGIRKVLGASVSQLWLLLSQDFIVLVLISCVIAAPVTYYYLHDWLQQYEYRISIQPLVFLIAAVTAIVITIITISFQAIKTALANPVKSLRTE